MNVPRKATRLSRRRRSLIALLASVATLCAMQFAPAAQAEYGVNLFDIEIANEDGSAATQAGSHPFAVTTFFEIDNTEPEFIFWEPSGRPRDLLLEQITGLAGDATAMPRCSTVDFIRPDGTFRNATECPDSTVIGINGSYLLAPILVFIGPVYNLEPPPGAAVRIGFTVNNVPITLDVGPKQTPDYSIVAAGRNIPQIVKYFGTKAQLWGDPSDPDHDEVRGQCGERNEIFVPIDELNFVPGPFSPGSCPVERLERPFLTLPRACQGPLASSYATRSWGEPDRWLEGSALTHDDSEPPNPQGFSGCGKLGFDPEIESKATADSAETSSGIDFNLSFDNEGLTSPSGLSDSDAKKAVVTLPEGMTLNPSIAEGLGVCAPAQLDRETISSAPGAGCPNASKIGTVQVDTPLVEEPLGGSVFLAQQDDPATTAPGAENPFDTMIAFYIVLKNPQLGVLVKLPAKVEPDEHSGRLIVTVDDAPQFPFSRFNLHFREGQRAPLITPPACGTYTTVAALYPWADPANPRTVTSDFQITRGVGGGPCPPGGVPPFSPGFEAGSLNNNAGSHSPFHMRLTRADGEQDMTKFSSVLPPGVIGSLRGIAKCPDAAAEAAKSKTGREEIAAPSCPANSQIGRSLAGAGVGSALVYVPGQIYLGGPFKGAPLSVIAITPAVAGPFDGGTVVVREALDLNSETAEVEVDGAASDPIPHILNGIPLKLRDLRVYVDRERFIINPTSCDESSAKATLFGGFLDVFSPADDVPVSLSTRYQAANCLNLGYKPALKLNLRGGTKRGGHPGLKAVLTPRPGDANTAAAQATLPRSAFLDQAHIRTICTRVQFAAEQCPKGSVYGFAKAWTPLLDEPFEGPVILRSSNNKLPDMVLALKGLVDVNVVSRIDSKNGGIRNTFDVVPDAPVSRFVLSLQGGKKGLIVNSRDLCAGKTSKATIRLIGHNGKVANLRPKLQPQCGGKRRVK